jgi:hypothetical protein
MTVEEGEDVARLLNGLVEAGDLLMLHVQRIDWDPRAATFARECWLESRAKATANDDAAKYWPRDAPGTTQDAHADPQEGT